MIPQLKSHTAPCNSNLSFVFFSFANYAIIVLQHAPSIPTYSHYTKKSAPFDSLRTSDAISYRYFGEMHVIFVVYATTCVYKESVYEREHNEPSKSIPSLIRLWSIEVHFGWLLTFLLFAHVWYSCRLMDTRLTAERAIECVVLL